MKIDIVSGDLVESLKGRDKGRLYIVVTVKDGRAAITDGKVRKTVKPKSKNVKHLKTVQSATLKEIADKIAKGEPVSDAKVRNAISAFNKKSEEE